MARRDTYNLANLLEVAQQKGFNGRLIAKEIQMPGRTLRRLVKHKVGLSFQNWLNGERLKLAAIMLKENPSVKAVCFDLGFKRVSHFSREFKRYHHVTPSQFQRQI